MSSWETCLWIIQKPYLMHNKNTWPQAPTTQSSTRNQRESSGNSAHCHWRGAREVFLYIYRLGCRRYCAKIEQVFVKMRNSVNHIHTIRKCHFSFCTQELGETYNQYCIALQKLAEEYGFQKITPEEIPQERLVFGIKDNKVREHILSESNFTLSKREEICWAAESMISADEGCWSHGQIWGNSEHTRNRRWVPQTNQMAANALGNVRIVVAGTNTIRKSYV